MIGLLLKLLPTLWPFLKEVFGGGRGRPYGGRTPVVNFRVTALIIIVVLVVGAFFYDVTKTLYTDNQSHVSRSSALEQYAKDNVDRVEALEAEIHELRTQNGQLGRELSAANAKLEYLEKEKAPVKASR